MTIFEINLSASIFIIGIIIIRGLFWEYLPKKTFKMLWWIAIIRLLLPISIPSKANIFAIMSSFAKENSTNVNTTGDLSNIELIVGEVANWGTGTDIIANGFSVSNYIWFLGVVLVLTGFIYTHIKHRKHYIISLPLETNYIINWKQNHSLKRKISIRYSDKIITPLTYGVINPKIIIPKSECEDKEKLDLILTHEYIHIKNFDVLTKYLLVACLSIHWFNPLVWVMYLLANRDIEIVCDNDVVHKYSNSGIDIRKSYAMTLLSLEEKQYSFSPIVSAFSKKPMEERVISIMKIKKNTASAILLAVIVIIGSATLFATQTPASDPKSTDIPPIKTTQPSETLISSSTPITPDNDKLLEDKSDEEGKLVEEKTEFEAATPDENLPNFILPITDVTVTNEFGGKTNHMGVDFIAKEFTEIYAIADGTVVYSKMMNESSPEMPAYGQYIVIDHGNGYKSLYAHCSKLYKVVGDKVKQGDLIGRVGMTGRTTGYNLHLEIRLNDKYLNPTEVIKSID